MIKRLLFIVLFIINISIIGYGQSSSQSTRRIWSGTSLPSVCQPTGTNIFYKSDTGVLYSCTATNTWTAVGSSSSGTVTTVSVVSANGLAGTVATATTTPAITLNTTITGLLKGNGTAISAASAGSDYENPLTFNSPLSRSTNAISCSTCGVTGSPLSQFASTTSLQLLGVISDETGTGALVFGTTPAFTTNITTPTILGVSQITGTTANMIITSGTGNSRTMQLQTTTSGGVATTFLTGGADQSSTFAAPILLPDGNSSTPSLSYSSAATTGFYRDNTTGGIVFLNGGTKGARIGVSMTFPSTATVGFAATVDSIGSQDTAIGRNGAGIVEANNGTLGTLRDFRARNYLVGIATAPSANDTAVIAFQDNVSKPTLAGTLPTALYNKGGEQYVQDSSGNETLISPHDLLSNEWIFKSCNERLNKCIKINMEQLVHVVEQLSGKKFSKEWKYNEN